MGPQHTKKILYVINHMDWFWSHRLPLAQGAKDAGWEILVAAHGASKDQKLRAYGFKGLELPRPDQGPAPLAALKIIKAIRNLIKTEKPDLVHVITIKYAFMGGLAARFLPDVKIVHTIAGLGFLFSGESAKARILKAGVGPLLKLALNHDRAEVIVQNPDDAALLIQGGFVDQARCHLIRGSGVDCAQFKYVEEPEDEPPLVIMPTRLVHDKGVAVFVEAARILKQRGVDARFQIAGGVTKHNPLAISEADMQEMTADGAAQWLGKVKDMPDLYALSTLVVYPSYYGEGIPKVLLEAMATGRAIVTTDHPGCREAVAHGENGLLVPVKDAAITADAIEALLLDPDRRTKMGVNSRERAENLFSVERVVQETLAVYEGE